MKEIIRLKEILEKNRIFTHAISLFNWDLETEAPESAVNKIANSISKFSEMSYNTLVNDEVRNIVYNIDENKLDEIDKKLIKNIKKDVFDKMSKIPVDKYTKYSKLLTISTQKWQEAKSKNDLSIFEPYLKEIIEYQKEFIKLRSYKNHPYSLLLSDYENDLTVEEADLFFEKIRLELTPVIKKIISRRREELEDIKKRFYSKKYDINKQKEVSKELKKILGFENCVLKESEHPFTTTIGSNKDVRITTHYYENEVLSSIYSTIHEMGHAIYEHQIDDIYDDNFLGGGVSMGIHESQSRIFENMFCKNINFVKKLYQILDEKFTLNITLDEFVLLINEVKESLIRIESDELTYPIHILIRYELEKEIFSDLDKEVDIKKLANSWAEKYEKYLGVKPSNYSEGILQDVHWSGGLFGYFPSYALGSAYAAQIYKSIEKNVNIDEDLSNLNFENINSWLKEKIHKFGSFKDPKDILLNSTCKNFDASYYISYLINKFSKIYGIEE